MNTTLRTDLTVRDICKGFMYNELEGKGLFGWSGRLTIQPEYQRNYIYADGTSNCPMCSQMENNRNRIYKLAEMDADHVSAWSKGGKTDISNCQLLCKTHNRMKGNK